MEFAKRVSSLQGSAIREMFKLLGDPEMISFAGGAPSPELFPSVELAEISEEIIKNNPAVALQYGVTEGYAPLAEQIRERMRKFGNLKPDNDVLVTSGGQQALDLCFKSLLNEGDVVVVEQPSFIGGLNSLRSYGAKLIGVPVKDTGLDTDMLEDILKRTKIKLLYTITTFQNPSGITMDMATRKRILELAEKYDFYVLEDNPYFELRFKGETMPSIKSMDDTGRVIYAGSFSKVLSAGMRLGWAVARNDIREKMVICKQVSDVHTTVLTQMIAAEFFNRYSLDEHIEKARNFYGKKCSLMLSAMDKYFPDYANFTRPEGGIFLWCALPEYFDTKKLLAKSIKEKVAFVPGFTCAIDMDAPCPDFRLNYSLPADDKIETGIRILADVIKNYDPEKD
ncbi:MAG: PLP-dependent aminotransferase family protein [Clostridia bacterium]|nr:PLP-dependent aminotransferase family protein [Clostridia bacterium]